jgi:hypothetical protein
MKSMLVHTDFIQHAKSFEQYTKKQFAIIPLWGLAFIFRYTFSGRSERTFISSLNSRGMMSCVSMFHSIIFQNITTFCKPF